MNITAIRASNFRSWGSADVTLHQGVTLLAGPNGSGKTSLIDAMLFAMYGVSQNAASLIQRGADRSSVAIDVELERGDVLTIERSIRRSGSGATVTLKAWLDGEDISAATAGETQKAIDPYLVSEDVLRASAFSTQHGGAAFTEAAPRDRKRVFGEILALGMWDQLHEDAKSEQREARAISAAAQVRVDQLAGAEERLVRAGMQLAAAKGELTDASLIEEACESDAARLAAEAEAAREASRQREAAVDAVDRARADHKRATQERAVADEALARAKQAAASAPSLEDARSEVAAVTTVLAEEEKQHAKRVKAATHNAEQIAEARRELASATQARDHAEDEESRLRARYAAASADACPECGQELHTPEAQAIVGRLAEQHTAAGLGVDNAADAIEAWQTRLDYLQANQPAAPDDGVVRAGRERLQAAQKRLADAEAIALLADTLDAFQQRAREAMDREMQTAETIRQTRLPENWLETLAALAVDEAVAKHQAALAAASAARTAHREAAAALATAEAAAQQAERDAAEEQAALASLTEATQREAVASILAAGFGPTGVPSLIIDNVLGQLADESNRVLAELGTPIRVDLRSQRVTQKGDLVDALDIIVLDGMNEAPYETLSGGERTRVALALRAALTRLLAAKSGARVRLLVIDEPAGLDAAGAEAFAAVLKSFTAAGVFETCIVVTHDERLADRIDRVIRIEKTPGGSSRLVESSAGSPPTFPSIPSGDPAEHLERIDA